MTESPLLCRPAHPRDREPVLDFLQAIWGGRDYVPEVWDKWLLQEPGLLAVAERGGEIVGQGHLLDLGLGEWWLEGLRVRPSVQGQGIGSHLHDYFVARWLETGGAVVRLATHFDRESVHKMCERTGFTRLTGFVLTTAEPLADGKSVPFQSAADAPVESLVDRLRGAEATAALGGLMNLGWRFARLQPERLAGATAPGRWRWRDGEGLALVLSEPDEQEAAIEISALDVPEDETPELLLDLRRLAAANNLTEVVWLAPLEGPYTELARAAGFEIAAEDQLYIYERVR